MREDVHLSYVSFKRGRFRLELVFNEEKPNLLFETFIDINYAYT